MPASEALTRLSQDPYFWPALLTGEGALRPVDPGTGLPDTTGLPDELRVCLPVAGGYGLVLDLDLLSGEQTLGLREPHAGEPVRLGVAAAGLPHPAALTFAELELCGRVIALDDPFLPHPGLVVALLSRFAPVTAGDDATAAAAVRAAAYRSLRRDVPPVGDDGGPEQAPLPLFADPSWWPRPPRPSAQVLTEDTIATLSAPAPAGRRVRDTERFPGPGLAQLVRLAQARLARLPGEHWYADTRVRSLARNIAARGDLRPVTDLLGVLTEAGCDHPTVLDALSEPLVPAEACWMVETLAGAEPGSLLRRHLVGPAN